LTKNAIKSDVSNQRYFSLGLAVFGYIFGITRFLFVYTDSLPETDPFFILYWKLGSIVSLIAFAALLSIIETYIVKTKYIFTGISIVGIILTIILPKELITYMNLIVIPVLLIDLIGAYLYVAVESKGTPRNNALRSLAAILLLVFGLLIDMDIIENLVGFNVSFIGAILMTAGLILYFHINYESEESKA
jgi:hypothetical protein